MAKEKSELVSATETKKYSLTAERIQQVLDEDSGKEGEERYRHQFLGEYEGTGVEYKVSFDFGTVKDSAGVIDLPATLSRIGELFGEDVVVKMAQQSISLKIGSAFRNFIESGVRDENGYRLPTPEEAQAWADSYEVKLGQRKLTKQEKLAKKKASMSPEEWEAFKTSEQERIRRENEELMAILSG